MSFVPAVHNCASCLAGSARSRRSTAPRYPHSRCGSARAPAGWAHGRGATCSPATPTAASRCGTWPPPWTWSARAKAQVGSRGRAPAAGRAGGGGGVTSVCSPRWRWPDRRGAAEAPGPVRPEHVPLRDPQHQPGHVRGPARPAPRVQLQVGGGPAGRASRID